MKFTIELAFLLIAYVIFAFLLISIPVRRKIISKKCGKLIKKLSDKSLIWDFAIYIIVAALYVVVYFRNFGVTFNLVLYACGILAVELITRDVSIYKKYGIYENGIVYDGLYIPFTSIIGFPVLKLPEEDQKNYDSKSLIIQTQNKGNKMLTFDSEEEYAEVIKIIFDMNPEFNKFI